MAIDYGKIFATAGKGLLEAGVNALPGAILLGSSLRGRARGAEGTVKGGAEGTVKGGAGSQASNISESMPTGGMSVNYQVNYIPGSPQHNARLNRSLSDAAYMQSEKEHNDAINYYLRRLPKNANAQQVNEALRKGIERERHLKRFWKDNRTLREYISPSSSAVSLIRIRPDNNIDVQFGGKGTVYTYRGGRNPYEAAQEAAKLALSHSIGQSMARKPGTWGTVHKLF